MESHSGRIPEFEHTHANSSLDDDQHLREESSVMASRWNEIGRIFSVSTCVIPATVVLAAIAVRLKRQIWALSRECLLLVLCLLLFILSWALNAWTVVNGWNRDKLRSLMVERIQFASWITLALACGTAQVALITCAQERSPDSQRLPRIQALAFQTTIVLVVVLTTISALSWTSMFSNRFASSNRYLRLACNGVAGLLTLFFLAGWLQPRRHGSKLDVAKLYLLFTCLVVAVACGIASERPLQPSIQHVLYVLEAHLTLLAAFLTPLVAKKVNPSSAISSPESQSHLSWLQQSSSLHQQSCTYRGIVSPCSNDLTSRTSSMLTVPAPAYPFRCEQVRSSLETIITRRESEADTIRNLSQLHQATRRNSTGIKRVRSSGPRLAHVSELQINTRHHLLPTAMSHTVRPRRHTVHHPTTRLRFVPSSDNRRAFYHPGTSKASIDSVSGSQSSQASSSVPSGSAYTPDSDMSDLVRQNFRLASLLHKGERRVPKAMPEHLAMASKTDVISEHSCEFVGTMDVQRRGQSNGHGESEHAEARLSWISGASDENAMSGN